MNQQFITVFTPTFNRAYILQNLYRSLQRQSLRSFEWLIIDDGSTDHTRQLVKLWQQDGNDFPIRYYKQENGGKCRAINRALDLAEGKLFFTVDSDDYLTDDALEKVDNWFKSLAGNDKIKGIVANRGFSSDETLNYIFPELYKDCTLLDMYDFPIGKNAAGNGERAFIFYTDFHRQYKYPEFENEKFMTEAVAWNRMAHDGYQMRFYNDIIWIFEYREDGLTKSGSQVFIDNPCGYGLWLKEKSDFLNESFIQKLQMHYTFACDLRRFWNVKKIAACIGASKLEIALLLLAHRLSGIIKKGKK